MKACFYYGSNNNEYKNCENSIKNIDRLLNYMMKNQIPAYVMKANIGSYTLKPSLIETQKLQYFINKHFRDFMPQSMRYYTIIHGYLMDLLII